MFISFSVFNLTSHKYFLTNKEDNRNLFFEFLLIPNRETLEFNYDKNNE